jgi:prolyl-tRNA synthetase
LIEKGHVVQVYWSGSIADEKKIKEETFATPRFIDIDKLTLGKCFYTNREQGKITYFAKAH